LRSEQLEWDGEVIKVSASMWITVRQVGETNDAMQQRSSTGLDQAHVRHGKAVEV
jgi:hypothetical protein